MSHYKTPWSSSSGLISDRLPSSEKLRSTPPTSKKKGNQKEPEASKTREVRRLEKLLNSLKKATGDARDPKEGCFCQARIHALSPYVPICRACGLILCTLNEPHLACPHCSSPLGTATTRAALISRIEVQISDQLAREAEERERAVQEAQRAAGAFPLLGQATPPSSGSTPIRSYSPGAGVAFPQPQRPTNQTHKVLSLNSKTKKVVMKTFSNPPSRPDSRAEQAGLEDVEELGRVSRPPTKKEVSGPWKGRLNGLEIFYVPLNIPEEKGKAEGAHKKSGSKKPKDKGKGKA